MESPYGRCVSSRIKIAFSTLAVAVGLAAFSSTAVAGPCPDADHIAAFAGDPTSRAALLCLVNNERAAVGAPALKVDRQLESAASSYAARLVAEHFFSHVDPAGGTLAGRISASGYSRGRDLFASGEDLAWGAGLRASPAGTLAAWMGSQGHRSVMLDPGYRDVGIGISPGTPVDVSVGATSSMLVGSRSQAAAPKAKKRPAAKSKPKPKLKRKKAPASRKSHPRR